MEPGGHHRRLYPHGQFQHEDLGVGSGERDRLLQWSYGETKEFLALRWDLDPRFMETKRNKMLWELVSAKMKEKGFHRTPDQCKCKWKNLVTRYRGSETMEAETSRQFPFQDDMRRIFSDRMERLLNIDEEKVAMQQLRVLSSSEEEEEEEEDRRTKKKKKVTPASTGVGGSASTGGGDNGEKLQIRTALKEFMRWQLQMEVQWLQALKKREVERRAMLMEWRRAMEAVAAERAEMDRRWREKEEERRGREEERAERRHRLIVALLTKLTDDEM